MWLHPCTSGGDSDTDSDTVIISTLDDNNTREYTLQQTTGVRDLSQSVYLYIYLYSEGGICNSWIWK